MSQLFSQLSTEIAAAVDTASAAIVQVQGHHRPTAGVVFADDLVLAPARALGDEAVTVRAGSGQTHEGHVLGHALSMGLGVVRVPGLGITPIASADEPKVGHLAIAVGRTWSGGVMATITNVTVVGGPLRTGRTSQIDRVIRIAQPPHGALTGGALIDGDGRALGLITRAEIRGTTVVLPATLAWPLAQQVVSQGSTRQGFIGISTTTVALPDRQREGLEQQYALLVTGVVGGGPADTAGILVGDIILAFEGQAVTEPESLITLLRGDRVGKDVRLTVRRGSAAQDVTLTVGERPRRERRR